MNLDHATAAQYLNGGAAHLNPAQRAALNGHLAECSECRAYARQVAELAPRLAGALHARWESVPVPASPVPAIQNRVRRQALVKQSYAAGGVLAGALLLAVFAFMLSSLLENRSAAPLTTPSASLSAAIIMEDYTVAPATLRGGEPLTITIRWRTAMPLTQTYNVFIHLLDPSSAGLMATLDTRPNVPVTDWIPGRLYTDTFSLLLPRDAAAGEKQVYVASASDEMLVYLGLYGLDGARVPLTYAGEVEIQWKLAQIKIAPPEPSASPTRSEMVPPATPFLPSPSAAQVLALSSAQRLAFETSRDGNWEVYLTAGGELQNLTQNAANDGNPLWAPDGQKILFLSDRSGQSGYDLMNADGSGVRPVPTGKAISFSQGAWSPNGQWLAGVSEPTATGPAQLCVVSIFGDEKSRCVEWRTEDGGVSSAMTETVTALPQWLADGQFVAFTFWHGGTGQVIMLAPWQNGPARAFALNAPANTDRRLVAGAPQGNRLAYLSSAGGQEVSLNIVRVLGVNQVMTETSAALLPEVPLAEYGDLAWSPDGRRLLFTIDWQGLQLYQLYVVNADGTGLTRLGDNLDFAQPVWSPDSRWIAFSRRLDLGAAADIYQLDVEAALSQPGAAAITRLTYTHGGANFHPQWQPQR